MDSEDQAQNDRPKDDGDAPKVIDTQPKEPVDVPADQDAEKQDVTSPGDSSRSDAEDKPTGEQKRTDETTSPSESKPQASPVPVGQEVSDESTLDSSKQQESDLQSERSMDKPQDASKPIDQVASDEPIQDSKTQEDDDIKSQAGAEEGTTPGTSTQNSAENAANGKERVPEADGAALRDSEPSQDKGLEPSDGQKQGIGHTESEGGQGSEVSHEKVDPADSVKPEDNVAPEGEQLMSEEQKEPSTVERTPDNQTSDLVGNNVKLENNAVVPPAEENGSTLIPEESKENAAVTIDGDEIPLKSNGTAEPSPSKRKYWEENWFLVLAIVLIVLTVIATIILVAILVPILSRKVIRPTRLPGNVIPKHYVLETRPYLVPDHFGFDGSVVITIVCVNATKELILHSAGLEIDEHSVAVVNLEGGHSPFVLTTTYDSDNEFVIFSLCEDLTIGTTYDVHVKFKGKLSEDQLGFTRVTYQKGDQTKHMAVTKFESIYARKAFPCFDEPAMKATFDVSIVRWKNMTSLSNMRRLQSIERDEHWVIDMYERSLVMSTYLVTFVVGELDVIRKGKVSLWAAKDVDHYHYALNVTSRLLEFYEEYLQVPYAISKLDQLAAEHYRSSAMEHWGIIIYRKTKIKSGVSEEKEIARIVSHELAHQWFGNLVTMNWWDQLWLNEGFAAYFGYLGASLINQEWKMEEEVIAYSDAYMHEECNENMSLGTVVVNKVETTQDVKNYLRPVVYSKGAALVRMMRMMLGDGVFRRGLKMYLSENAFSNVEQDELWRQLTKAQLSGHPKDMNRIMDPWTKNAFYPLITVKRNYRQHEATVEQTSCVNAFGGESKDLWPVPITWMDRTRRADSKTTTINLLFDYEKETLRRLPGKESWVLVNVERLGFFRVNYDETNWELLLWQLRHNYEVIPTVNRRQLILDALFFATVKQLSHIVALDIITYYPFEKEEIVLRTMSSEKSISYYGNMVKYTSVEKYWREFVHYLFNPIFIKYARIWQEKLSPTNDRHHFAWWQIGILCYEKHEPCLLEARKFFKGLLEGNPPSISFKQDLLIWVLCALARNATTEEWNNMNRAYKIDHSWIHYLLACTEDDKLFQGWFKEYLASDEAIFPLPIRLSEERWRYMIETLRSVWKTTGKERLGSIVSSLADQQHSKETLKMLRELYDSHKADISELSARHIERRLSLTIRQIPDAEAIRSVGTWLSSRSWEKIDIREFD